MIYFISPMIMKDQTYFTYPNDFNPDNFSPEKRSERGPYPFLAFGHGPRNCVGMRIALLLVKSAITRIVEKFRMVPCSKTVDHLEPEPSSTQMLPKGGIWIKLQHRSF